MILVQLPFHEIELKIPCRFSIIISFIHMNSSLSTNSRIVNNSGIIFFKSEFSNVLCGLGLEPFSLTVRESNMYVKLADFFFFGDS